MSWFKHKKLVGQLYVTPSRIPATGFSLVDVLANHAGIVHCRETNDNTTLKKWNDEGWYGELRVWPVIPCTLHLELVENGKILAISTLEAIDIWPDFVVEWYRKFRELRGSNGESVFNQTD